MNSTFRSRFHFFKQPLSHVGIGAVVVSSLLFAGCGELAGVVRNKLTTHGGGQTIAVGPRRPNPADVVAPPGYRVELVAKGLTYPTGIIFDDQNRLYVVESDYAYVEHYATPRLLRIESNGRKQVIATGERRHAPWTGGDFHGDAFYISEGGNPGRVSRITMDGRLTPIVDGLPSKGDHHTDRAVAGPDGWIYFGQGAPTNSVVGEDNAIFGWLLPHPEMHDIPGQDIVLTGQNFNSQDPRVPLPVARQTTGTFVPYGKSTHEGEVIKGQVPATCGNHARAA
jgi:glucose/arabinose dehydrogenase